MPAPFLSVSGVTKTFGGLAALAQVSFELEQGCIMCVIGPNGSGKTTLFNIITGLLPANAGSISFKGREIGHEPPHEIARLGISRTFQSARLFPSLTILENLVLPQFVGSRTTVFDALAGRARARREKQEVRARAERLLGEIGGGRLYPRRFDYPHTCSLGEQRILEIIRVLAMDPELILMDEPTQGLNPAWVAEMLKVVGEIRARDKTILFIEHKMSVVMKLSDWVTVLNSGQKISEGPPEAVRRDPAVIQAYLGE